MTAVRRGYFDLHWGQVHFRTAAADPGLPLLLLLHQSPLSSRNYERLLPLLAGDCRPYAIDTPGFGGSDHLADTWEVADYAAMVWEIADRLGDDRIMLFARATGAVFAAEAALQHSERVRCLMLHGMPVYTDAERADRIANYAPPYRLAPDGSHLQWIWHRINSEYPWIEPELATMFVRDFLAAGPDFATAYRSIWRYDLPNRLRGRMAVPTLLLGCTGDRIAFMHERATALLPQAKAVVLAGATDFVAEQDPQLFARHLLQFMRAHR
jgi:pimeloyl-ACP methyl ester carboxylesterase